MPRRFSLIFLVSVLVRPRIPQSQDNIEVMRKRVLDCIGGFRPVRREGPQKSGYGTLRCWRNPTGAHVLEAGFGTIKTSRIR